MESYKIKFKNKTKLDICTSFLAIAVLMKAFDLIFTVDRQLILSIFIGFFTLTGFFLNGYVIRNSKIKK
ncbi:MAG: hypothetical protein ACRCZK_06840 [Oscillospiraceae bacterium]